MPFPISLCLALSLAQSPKSIDAATFDRLAMDSLRAVHDRGAKLFNEDKDYPGCLRMYDGAVRTIQPLLAHHPDIQKRIDVALASIETETNPRTSAFRLHELIEAVRGDLRDSAKTPVRVPRETAPMPGPRQPLPSPSPVPLSGLPVPTPATVVPEVNVTTGRVTLDGKPVANCELQFVSLDQAKINIRTVRTDDRGDFRIDSPVSGRYAVTVSGSDVPSRYQSTSESGIRVVMTFRPDRLDVNLKK